jgi:hypothetical protein
MKKFILFLIVILAFNPVYSQKRFENKTYGFSIEEPHDWQIGSNEDILKNLDQYDIPDEKLAEILKKNKGSILLTSFYKYKIHEHPGLIPTIKINVHSNPAKTFEDFKSMIGKSSERFTKVFTDFTYLQAPVEIEVAGIRSVYFTGKYSMKTQNGKSILIKSRTYAIPRGDYFFQLNFIDGLVDNDCTAEFDALVKTIRINVKK